MNENGKRDIELSLNANYDNEYGIATAPPPPIVSAENDTTSSTFAHSSIPNNDDILLSEQQDAQLDAILHETGKSAHGIGLIEVYALQNLRLVPVGFWIHSEIMSNPNLSEREKHLLQRPVVSYPNDDLVGLLWSMYLTECEYDNHNIMSRDFYGISGGNRRHSGSVQRRQPPRVPSITRPDLLKRGLPPLPREQRLNWRKLKSVLEDPDVSHGARTLAIYKAGLIKAAGIRFHVATSRGMAVYYALAGADSSLTTAPQHERYLHRVTLVKAAILAAMEARQESLALVSQNQQSHDYATDTPCSQTTAETVPTGNERDETRASRHGWCQKYIVAWARKARGCGAQIPPCVSWFESFWTFCGSFLGLLIMYGMNHVFHILSNEQYFLVAGPFGALMMLQYGLPGSPTAQPRNVIFGHLLGGTISLALTYIPESILPTWLRLLLSPALAIGAMVKLGVPCPPASAHSLIYAQGEYNWQIFAVTIMCCFISIVPAIVINNLNPKRMYPTYWGYSPRHLSKFFQKKMQQRKEKEQMKRESAELTGGVEQVAE